MKKLITMLLASVLMSSAALADVAESVLTTGIVNRQPVDDLQAQYRVPAQGISKVYFFTRVTDYAGKQVMHRWLYGDQVMAEVNLSVGSDNWRTYSSKRMVSAWNGDWQIDVLVDGEVVHSFPFSVVNAE